MADKIQKDANARYFQAAVAHQTGVQRMSAGEQRSMNAIMLKWDRRLARVLRTRLPRLMRRRFNRLDPFWLSLRREIRENRKAAIAEVKADFREMAVEFGENEENFELLILAAALAPFTVKLGRPSAAALRAAIFSQPFAGPSGSGLTFSEWFGVVERSAVSTVVATVQRGLQERATLNSLVAQVIGTRSQAFGNGVVAAARRGIATTVATTFNHTSNAVREAVWSANGSLISHLKWKSILDGRTTQICRKRSNRNAPLNGVGNVPPPRLSPPGARPPALPRCRSMMVPVLRGGGPVPDFSYQDFLVRQPASFQDDLLGKSKGALFRRGGLTIEQFSDGAGGELTMKQLARTQPQAFAAANLDTDDFL